MVEAKSMEQLICEECEALAKLLIAKNRSYGNSVAEPACIFAKQDPLSQMDVRIDDKINRIAKGGVYKDEDTEKDLIGYLILKRCVRRWLNEEKETKAPSGDCDCIGELSDDALDRAADLFLAHTRGINGDTLVGERICQCERNGLVGKSCQCDTPSKSEVLCETS
jgi:hypothetical protein